jgi:DNA-binding transcriptional regulator YiaG
MDWLINKQRNNVNTIGKLGKLSLNDLERIIKKIDVTNLQKDSCWIWNGTVQDHKGKGHQHGVFWYKSKYVQIHRIMYHNFREDVPIYKPGGFIILHKCSHTNNGRCINPWHLDLGTSKENTKDAIISNSLTLYGKNEENPMSKLTNDKIIEIRNLKDLGISQKQIAKIYSINQSQVSRYWNNKTRII